MKIKLLELFSGIGGFAKGLSEAGFDITKHYFSEVDKHAIANYRYNFKNAEYIGSVISVRGAAIERPNIITFGSPCQDFSLAGNRLGMDGQRSSLILHAIRLITELRPDVFIWENVKGAFSSNNSEDFWGIIQAFANIGGYRIEWQLLNTAWFLPQNRERIYLIGHLAERSECGVFPIGEEIGLSSQSRTITEKQIASCLQSGENSHIANGEYKGMNLIEVGNLYESGSQDGKDFSVLGISQCLSAGHGNVPKIEVKQINENLESGGKQPYQQNRVYDADGIAPAIMKDKSDLLIMAQRGRGEKGEIEQQLEPRFDGVTNTITSVQKDNLVITQNRTQSNEIRTYTDIAPAVSSTYGTGGGNIPYANNIRRLTEIECERLQGYPDNWTEFGDYDGVVKKIPKTQRYKLCGNAVTVRVVKEIGLKLKLKAA